MKTSVDVGLRRGRRLEYATLVWNVAGWWFWPLPL